MKNIIIPAVILAIVAFLTSFVLSHVKKITYPRILKQAKEKQEKALSFVLPGFRIGSEQRISIDGKEFPFWIGEKTVESGTLKGYAVISSSSGYSGGVKSMIGFDENWIVLGISILQQTETPGLGARCIEIASKETLWDVVFGERVEEPVLFPWFQEQFKGLNANNKIKILRKGNWKPELRDELLQKNAISAITGATITTRAVTRSLRSGVLALQKELHSSIEDGEEIR